MEKENPSTEAESPHPKSLKEQRAEIAELLDQQMLKILRNGGIRVITGHRDDGSAVVETVDIPAAMLNTIRQRMKDLGMNSVAVPGTPAGDLRAMAQARLSSGQLKLTGTGGPLPPVSDDDDEATT